MHPKTIVMIPTYNEVENISSLLDNILNAVPFSNILVVDDNSPDGTWKIVEERSKKDDRIKLLHRVTDRGRGKAGVAGFKYAIDQNADYVVEMDGDLSHNPQFLPSLISAARGADIVLGSRYVEGGKDCRGFIRRFVSKLAGIYIKTILGFKVKDPTSGYRCFKRGILEKIDLDTLFANDPFIVTEVLYRCHRNNARIAEVPIVFEDRKQGKSKLGFGTLISNLFKVIRLRITG